MSVKVHIFCMGMVVCAIHVVRVQVRECSRPFLAGEKGH